MIASVAGRDCDPCEVESEGTVNLFADASDPNGDTLTYAWTAPAGRFTDAGAIGTRWQAPAREGLVPIRVTVTDGGGRSASDTINVTVNKWTGITGINSRYITIPAPVSRIRIEATHLLGGYVVRLYCNANFSRDSRGALIAQVGDFNSRREQRGFDVIDYATITEDCRNVEVSRWRSGRFDEDEEWLDVSWQITPSDDE